ncbi:MAG: tetratricopeptide repeat protein, partial [Candidatus Binatota bacterium]
PRLYDLIISEPSNPWIAGVASLFSREFYTVAKGKLKTNGILAQWIHYYSMSPDDFRMVLRTFAESFPQVTMWNMQESDFLLIGSLQEQRFDYPLLSKIFKENRTLRQDFKELGLSDVDSVLGLYRMGRKELLEFAAGADLNTDDNARLEFSAPRSLGKSTTDLNRRLMDPFVTDPPWKPDARRVSPAQHRYYLSQAFKASGWHDRALKEVEQAISLEPRNADYHLLRAQILIAQDKTAEAAQAAEKALEYGPHKAKAVLALAEELYTQQAKKIYLRIVNSGAKEFLPYVGLGAIALRQKEFVEAQRWLEQAAKIQPKHPAVLLALGRLELAKGNYARAVTLLEESREGGEESATLYSELGEAYSQLKQWEKAASVLERALQRQHRNTGWRLLLAKALGQLGRTREAEIKYREVLAIDPSSSQAWKGLKSLGEKY